LEEDGRVNEALAYYQRPGDAGDPGALRAAARMMDATGRGGEAARLLRYGREPDGTTAQPWMAGEP
jgi:hypothetical protein